MLPGLPAGAVPPPDGLLWTLRDGRHTAVCGECLPPLGLGLRLDINGDTMRKAVGRTFETASAISAAMLASKGWQEAAS